MRYHPASAIDTPPLARSLAVQRIPGMDALRLLAVLMVMMGHTGLIEWSYGLHVLLVFSGFLITRMLMAEHERTGTIDVPRFVWHRATRLMPALLAYTALGAVYLAVRGTPVPWWAMASVVAQVHNYYQGLTGGQTHYLSHVWSLSLQEQFYVLWPVILLWAWRRGMRLEWVITGYLVGVWGIRIFECLVLHLPDEYLYRALETRSDNLAAGGLMAVLLRKQAWTQAYDRLRRWGPALLLLAGVFLRLSVLHRANFTYKYVFSLALDPVLIALVMPFVIVAASSPSWLGRALNSRLVVAGGQGSYGMYLSHQILLHGCFSVLLHHHWGHGAAFAVSAVVVGCMGHLSFRYFETPVRSLLEARTSHWFQRRQTPAQTPSST